MLRKVCIVTGTRAEYGLLSPLMNAIKAASDLKLQVVATAMHLEDAFGHTVDVIRQDGFSVDAEVPMHLTSDAPAAIAASTGFGLTGLAQAFERLKPDIVVLLGDRFETLAAATAGALMRIPLAHIHGGEISEGAIDDAMRHAITKLSQLHFVAAEPFRQRVIQMGESPDRVFTVGTLGLDNFLRIPVMTRAELAQRLSIGLDRPFFLITYHPATLEDTDPLPKLQEMLAALDRFADFALVFTKANADAGGRAINGWIEAFVAKQPKRAVLIASLGQEVYLTALREAAAVIGNSSSGIIEAPAVGTPTVNLGSRQRGRPQAKSIMNVNNEERDAIEVAIRKALDSKVRGSVVQGDLPYGRPGDAAGAIMQQLRGVHLSGLLKKKFHDQIAVAGQNLA
jgi:UDP-hydrolysing UDP-N-acetyl-D-glucosamine 2-epimerase